MPDEPEPSSAIQKLASTIVAAYVRRNPVPLDQLPSLILATYEGLRRLGQPVEPAQAARTPAVSIRQSVRPEAVVCLDCGWTGKMLRRHLGGQHGLTPEQYRQRWKLPSTHPLTAPAYSEHRASLAKQLGLGHNRRRRSTTRRTKK